MAPDRGGGGRRILIAPDSFGGTLTASQAAAAMADGWARSAPRDRLRASPLSDGGPGFIDVLAAAWGPQAEVLDVPCSDPLGRPVTGRVLSRTGSGRPEAYVESADALGVHHLDAHERDPVRASSAGLAPLIMVAAQVVGSGGTVVVGLGGSGVNDGGAGLVRALGARPVDARGRVLPEDDVLALRYVARLEGTAGPDRLRGVRLIVATDVDNPLLGPRGATAMFGAQKGVTASVGVDLEEALRAWVSVMARDLVRARAPGAGSGACSEGTRRWALVGEATPGGGAAGGVGAAMLALGARRRSGAGLVADAAGLDRLMDDSDVVVTGEGRLDRQTGHGKVVAEVARRGARAGRSVLAVVGSCALERARWAVLGLDDVESAEAVALEAGEDPSVAREGAATWVARAAEVLALRTH